MLSLFWDSIRLTLTYEINYMNIYTSVYRDYQLLITNYPNENLDKEFWEGELRIKNNKRVIKLIIPSPMKVNGEW